MSKSIKKTQIEDLMEMGIDRTVLYWVKTVNAKREMFLFKVLSSAMCYEGESTSLVLESDDFSCIVQICHPREDVHIVRSGQ